MRDSVRILKLIGPLQACARYVCRRVHNLGTWGFEGITLIIYNPPYNCSFKQPCTSARLKISQETDLTGQLSCVVSNRVALPIGVIPLRHVQCPKWCLVIHADQRTFCPPRKEGTYSGSGSQ